MQIRLIARSLCPLVNPYKSMKHDRLRITILHTRQHFLLAFILVGSLAIQAQDSLTNNSIMVYGINDLKVILINQSISDSLYISSTPGRMSTSKERNITVSHELLRIYVTKNKKPFRHFVNQVNLRLDQTDSTRLEDLEAKRVVTAMDQASGWTDVKSFPRLEKKYISLFPLFSGEASVTESDYFTLFEGGIFPYHSRTFTIRDKHTNQSLLNLHITLTGGNVFPFLLLTAQDNSSVKLIDSFLNNTSPNFYVPQVADFANESGSKPTPKQRDTAKLLHNQNLYLDSVLVLFFKKHSHLYPDSSMEYRLYGGAKNDTNWVKTGHKLALSGLIPGTHYKLQIRYELHPACVQEHTFYVVPKWYQARLTKTILAGMLILGLMLISLLVYRHRLNKSRNQKEKLSLEIKAIRSQLNPHFIFNALTSIQGLINKNDVPAANRYLTSFSMLLRESLHHHNKEMVPLATEISLLTTYLNLEQLRFNFRYQIITNEDINQNATEIPYLILQPLVENAVKHGVSSLGENGNILIEFIKKGTTLVVALKDNGGSFDDNINFDGFGLKLTRTRISLLNQSLNNQPIELTFKNENLQTLVYLSFSNWL